MLLARPVPVRLRGVTVTPTDPADINRQIRAAERALADRPADEETEGVAKRAGFIMGTVFDVTQTEPSDERERTDGHRPEAVAGR